jgi:hypothetical protein
MGKTSNDLKEFRINRGKGDCRAVYGDYWGVIKLRDLLWKIYRNHKIWGVDWYRCVKDECYEEALAHLNHIVVNHEGAYEAIDIINLIIDIEMGGTH